MNYMQKCAEKVMGGLADFAEDSKFDAKALHEGIEEEMEHTDSKAVAKEIAKDHLVEHGSSYYKKLEKMTKNMPKPKA